MQPSSGQSRARLVTAPFLIAVGLLAAAVVLAGPVAAWKSFKRVKLALPLKKDLDALNAEALEPYRVLDRVTLNSTILEALGTERYISWLLEDTSVSPNDPLRNAHLLVTYYSGGVDMVPHTPDVCMLGAGYQPAQRHENMAVQVSTLGAELQSVPVRVCTFMRTAVFHKQRHSVVYTFFSNGRFVCDRDRLRIVINDPRDTYAFFSKVEISFPRATRTQSVDGARKLLERVLPVLIEDHWPDFDKAELSGGDGRR